MDIILNAKIVYYFSLCMCICGCGDESSTLSVIPQEVYSGSLIGLELTVGPRGLSVYTFPELALQGCTIPSFTWVLGIELKASYLCNNHFTDWAFSPAPKLYLNRSFMFSLIIFGLGILSSGLMHDTWSFCKSLTKDGKSEAVLLARGNCAYLLDSRNGCKVILVYEGVLSAQGRLHFLFLLAWERE